MPEQQLSLELGRAGRDAALGLLERTRADWLTYARSYAVLHARLHGSVTADDIHERWPIPEGVDPRVMGAALKIPELAPEAHIKTTRRQGHAGPRRRHVLRERNDG